MIQHKTDLHHRKYRLYQWLMQLSSWNFRQSGLEDTKSKNLDCSRLELVRQYEKAYTLVWTRLKDRMEKQVLHHIHKLHLHLVLGVPHNSKVELINRRYHKHQRTIHLLHS